MTDAVYSSPRIYLSYSEALAALRAGDAVTRPHMGSKRVVLMEATEIPWESVNARTRPFVHPGSRLSVQPYFVLVQHDPLSPERTTWSAGWSPTADDQLAQDWYVYEAPDTAPIGPPLTVEGPEPAWIQQMRNGMKSASAAMTSATSLSSLPVDVRRMVLGAIAALPAGAQVAAESIVLGAKYPVDVPHFDVGRWAIREVEVIQRVLALFAPLAPELRHFTAVRTRTHRGRWTDHTTLAAADLSALHNIDGPREVMSMLTEQIVLEVVTDFLHAARSMGREILTPRGALGDNLAAVLRDLITEGNRPVGAMIFAHPAAIAQLLDCLPLEVNVTREVLNQSAAAPYTLRWKGTYYRTTEIHLYEDPYAAKESALLLHSGLAPKWKVDRLAVPTNEEGDTGSILFRTNDVWTMDPGATLFTVSD